MHFASGFVFLFFLPTCTCTMLTSLLCHAELLIPAALARGGGGWIMGEGFQRLQDVKHRPQHWRFIHVDLPHPNRHDSYRTPVERHAKRLRSTSIQNP